MDTTSILTDTPQNVVRKYYRELISHHIPVKHMIMFGSYAKGTNNKWSDLDICVVSEDFGKDGWKELIMLKKLTAAVDTMIEPHPYNPNDLTDRYDPLAKEIRTHGIQII